MSQSVTCERCGHTNRTLTSNQSQVLAAIEWLHDTDSNLNPTNAEIATGAGISASTTKRALDELEEKGYIRRVYDRSRRIEIELLNR